MIWMALLKVYLTAMCVNTLNSIMLKISGKSFVWKYLKRLNNEDAKCALCECTRLRFNKRFAAIFGNSDKFQVKAQSVQEHWIYTLSQTLPWAKYRQRWQRITNLHSAVQQKAPIPEQHWRKTSTIAQRSYPKSHTKWEHCSTTFTSGSCTSHLWTVTE